MNPYPEIFVSSHNTLYMAWQTQLFCHSAWTKVGQYPTIIVHEAEGTLRPEYIVLRECGCKVVEARSFAVHPTGEYLARNEPGSLRVIASDCGLLDKPILFCEPDMLFVRPIACSSVFAGEYYGYMHYSTSHIAAAITAMDVAISVELLDDAYKIGVPYVIPERCILPMASRWIEVLDSFRRTDWIDIMYAFGIAAALEHFQIEPTHNMILNHDPAAQLPGDKSLIHYCYGDHIWNKRDFLNRSPLCLPDSELPRPGEGTVLGEIMAQLREAKAFFNESGA